MNTINNNGTPAAVERVRKFLHEWDQLRGNDPERIYSLHWGDEREAVLLASDLALICRSFPRPPVPPVYGPPSGRFIPCVDKTCETCHGSGEFPTGAGYTRAWVPCGEWREYADDENT